jgi:2-aminobenzoate-CoA ligase
MPRVNNKTSHVDLFAQDRLPPGEQWPVLLLDQRELRYPARLNCAVELVDRMVDAGRSDAVAFRSQAETLTYGELRDRVDRIARVLVEDLGLIPGNRVLLRSANNPTLIACWLAVAKAGGVIVATMPLLRPRELTAMIEKAQVGLALCDERVLGDLETAVSEAPVCRRISTFNGGGKGIGGELERLAAGKPTGFDAIDTALDDVVLIAFTSGTTGEPKATMHFHRDVLAICDTFSRSILGPLPQDVFIGSPPIGFTFGLGGIVLFPLRVGASSVLLESAAPELFMQAIADFDATIAFTAPTGYRMMLRADPGSRLKTLRRCVSAGETLPLPVFTEWYEATGMKIIDGIGSTEMLHIFISAADDDIRPGTTGKPVPGYQAMVVDEEMQRTPIGQVGRLAVRGPTGCRYLDDPRQTSYVVDGWNLPGDTYVVDEEGYFHYQARSDDLIIASGYNVAPPEVEQVMIEHPAVHECAVVGAQDELRGALVKAFVVLVPDRAGSPELVEELQAFVKARLAPYKYPRAVEFIEALPRTSTGKVQRNVLRDRG